MGKTKKIIKVADFTDAPFNNIDGKKFRQDYIMPYLDKYDELLIDLDDTYGFPITFIREVFGVMVTKVGLELTLKAIQFKSEDDPKLISRIRGFMLDQFLEDNNI